MTFQSGNAMNIVFVLDEGDQYTVHEISLEGVTDEEKELFLRRRSLKPGDMFNREKLQQDIVLITEYYADQGYAFADVKPVFSDVDKDTKTVHVVYHVEKGKQYYIENIRIQGNTKTRDKVIRREMSMREGDLYSISRLRGSRADINRLGFFDEINLNTQPGHDPDRLDLLVDVKEGQTGTLSGGAGFSSTDKFILMANITQSNLFGLGQILSLNAEVGGTRQNFSLSFTEPWLFDIPLSAGFDIFNTKYDYTDFTRGATGGAARLGYEFYRHLRGNIMYRYEVVDITGISIFAPDIIKSEEGKSTTSSVTFSLVRNTLDNPLLPTKGSINVASVELAGLIFGGENDFVKLNLDSGWYFPLFWNTVISLRGRLGLGYGIAGETLPVFERFFVGGISTVRGFDVRSLGPTVQGEVIGGNKELIFNLEYIFPLVPQVKLRGLVFFDAGNAFSEDEDIRLETLRLSVGSGFRWFSPLGPLTLVVGFPLDRMAGEKGSAVQFTIGTPF
jgi:outer membrane protein insertion porin family